MVSKNNTYLKELKLATKTKQRFALRKLSVGVASVLLGTTVMIGVANADTDTTTSTTPINSNIPQTSATNNQSQNIQTNEVTLNSQTDQYSDNNLSNEAQSEMPSNWQATPVYSSGNSVPASQWFQVSIQSPTLTNVHKGDEYSVSIDQANSLGLNYDGSDISDDHFNIKNNGDGTYDLTAKEDYDQTYFNLKASMMYPALTKANTTIALPISIRFKDQNVPLNTHVNITPTPKPTYEESHPMLKYVCFGYDKSKHQMKWGIYINYNKTPLNNLDIDAAFNGNQKLIKDQIMVYKVADDEITDKDGYAIDATNHNYEHYDYDSTVAFQQGATDHKLTLKQDGPLTFNNTDYSKQPLYVYFVTEIPESTDPATISSDINLGADGVKVALPNVAINKSGNSADSDATNRRSKTVKETIHYVFKDTGKQAAPDYNATGLTFTQTGSGDWSDDQQFNAVPSPVLKGYTADQVQIDKQTVSHDSKDLEFTVTYTKNPDEPVSKSKTVKETIHYVFKDSGKQAAPDYKATGLTFTRTGLKDAVTDEISWGAWSKNQSFAAKESPTIKGYAPDQTEIASQSVGPTSDDLDFTVYYDKQEPTSPSNPTQPTQPSQSTNPTPPTQPSQVTTPTQPTQPSQITDPTQPTQLSQSTDPTPPTQPSQATTPTPTQPTQPSQVTDPTQPTQLSQSTDPTQPTQPSQVTSPTQPTQPSQVTTPTQPTQPSQATDPTQPTQPSQATDPTQPTQPSQVTTPTQPTQPSQSTNPTQPTQPSQSTDPTQPTQLSQAIEPIQSTYLTNQPGAPEISNEPGQPVVPTNLAISGMPTEPVTMSKSEHSTKLPQTGNENSKLATIIGAGLLGILAAGLGLGKKRRHN